MMRSLSPVLLALTLLSQSATALIDTVDVDLTQYVGRWYQMYADLVLFSTFERNSLCSYADYGLNDDGTVSVFNNARLGSVDGPFSNVTGTAVATGKPGKLRVTFDDAGGPFPAPYWIADVGEVIDGEYQWAIVTDPFKAGLYVLARDPDTYMDKYDATVQDRLTELGFTRFYNKPMAMQQEGCTYPSPEKTKPQTTCPVVNPVDNLNVSEFIRLSWYAQEMQLNDYQPEDTFNCVVATYALEDKSVPFFSGEVISVYNYANQGGVNGGLRNASLCARVIDPTTPSSLSVAPCFLPNFLAGPYLVVAMGVDADTQAYSWIAVSAGQPTEQYDDGCTTPIVGSNGAGLWILTRDAVASQETIDEAHQALTDLGYTLSQLLPVNQDGCNYEGAVLKVQGVFIATFEDWQDSC